MTTLVVLSSFSSMALLILHNEDANSDEEANHQQYCGDSGDYNCVHIHGYVSCTCET